MSVDLNKLVSKQKITLDDLNKKTIAIDAYNMLYQFLSIIRQADGTPLMNKSGKITSHLSGIFYRASDFILHGIKPIFVFDGIPSILKQRTIEARIKKRQEAYEAWNTARELGKIEEAKSFAQRSTRVNKEIVESAKHLLDLMGIGYLDAPSEAEAQASYMCKQDLVFAAASQDYDTILFGSKYVVRNLSISGKRKLPKKNIYINIETEILDLEETKRNLGLNQNQLIWVGLMLGTDFNEGIRGIGPKTSVKIARQSNSLNEVIDYVKEKYKKDFDFNIKEVEQLFENPEIKKMSEDEIKNLLDKTISKYELIDFMCKENDFDISRIEKFADQLIKIKQHSNQKTLF
ncbi:MAG: flap endonuclease-1 [Candidatus Marsarchaeota archaeon]|nr:flap endonuclease-1 [Candidatus Marsarchaeota archaeon]MCL5094758.1 flap endonuclease-1 [Candidatus Marsarchaeota archaeon]